MDGNHIWFLCFSSAVFPASKKKKKKRQRSFTSGICLSLILAGSVLPLSCIVGRKWLLLWSGDECTLETLKISETISEEREKLKLSLRKEKKREKNHAGALVGFRVSAPV